MYLKIFKNAIISALFLLTTGSLIAQTAEENYQKLVQLEGKVTELLELKEKIFIERMKLDSAELARETGVDPTTIKRIRLISQPIIVSEAQNQLTAQVRYQIQIGNDAEGWFTQASTLSGSPVTDSSEASQFFRFKF